uniref:ACT domain-containing protein ACR n=1 Tax=Anthurium amnicola TaxID=1678845 RepID=A0A1D1YEK3_9ARAE
MEWPVCLDEYQKLVNRMNTPRVVLDNDVCATATLIMVDSARKHGALLEAVRLLTDLDLSVKKAYISSDGRWFMDVFHVTDLLGRKLADDSVRSHIEQCLGAGNDAKPDGSGGLTALELAGANRPGLLSEVFAVLDDLRCDVVEAMVWTNRGRVASLIRVRDEEGSASPVGDSRKTRRIEGCLRNLLAVVSDRVHCAAMTAAEPCLAATRAERRLHQMMSADGDYERASAEAAAAPSPPPPSVSVQNWADRCYSIVNVQCRDRPKLLFDVLCALTDMECVVFHGTVDTDGDRAHQEFCIRRADGSPIGSEAERQRVILCLQAAIQRRTSEGVRLELEGHRRGLLSGVTRVFRENGLSLARAEVSSKGVGGGGHVRCVFWLTDASGYPAEPGAIEAVRQRIGAAGSLKVTVPPRVPARRKPSWPGHWEEGGGVAGLLYLGSLVWRNLHNLGLIKSC